MEMQVSKEFKRGLYILGGLIGCAINHKALATCIILGFISIYFGFILLADLLV